MHISWSLFLIVIMFESMIPSSDPNWPMNLKVTIHFAKPTDQLPAVQLPLSLNKVHHPLYPIPKICLLTHLSNKKLLTACIHITKLK